MKVLEKLKNLQPNIERKNTKFLPSSFNAHLPIRKQRSMTEVMTRMPGFPMRTSFPKDKKFVE